MAGGWFVDECKCSEGNDLTVFCFCIFVCSGVFGVPGWCTYCWEEDGDGELMLY